MAKSNAGTNKIACGACVVAVASAGVGDAAVADTIQLFAIGANASRNGKPPIVRIKDRAHAERVAVATAAWHKDAPIVVDYDHQSVFGARAGVGGTARAAGWMSSVYADDAGVWAKVDWTEAAASALHAREYRFISPVFHHDAQGNVIRVINAALTNTPSLDLAAVASAFSESSTGAEDMNYSAIARALGLGEDASEEEILRAIANISGVGAAMTSIATALGVAADADLVATATALKKAADDPDPSKFVPIDTVAALQTSVQSLTASLGTLQADKRKAKIDQAQVDGKLPPALVAHATSITDETALDAFLGALPAGGLGKLAITDPAKLNADGKLDDEQLALCSSMGWDPEAYLAQLKKDAE